jgi:hypothetical protein
MSTAEIVIATTSAERAEQMQKELVGHTMSGEALEQRSHVQLTSADDFLGAALRIYEITAIRCEPSLSQPLLTDVIAEYRRAIFLCEACGKEHSDYPEQLSGLDGSAHHYVCSPVCRKIVQERLREEMAAYRVALGDPIAVGIAEMWHNQSCISGRLYRILSNEELRTIGLAVRQKAHQEIVDALTQRIVCQDSLLTCENLV